MLDRNTDLGRFEETRIARLTGLTGPALYDPETSECLLHEDKWPKFVESKQPEVSILITAFNKLGYTFNCLQSVMASCSRYNGKYEVIVVDDGSTDRTRWLLSRIRGLNVVPTGENRGFVRSNILGAREARGRYVVLLNNDTIVTSGWLEHLIETFQTHSQVGAVGSKLIYPSGVLQEAGSIVWNDGTGWNYGRNDDPNRSEYNYVREVDYCSAASLMASKSFVRPSGIFDEQYNPGYYEDTDLCFYVRSRGAKVVYQPSSRVIHFEGVSHGRDTSSGIKRYQIINREKFVTKWRRTLQTQYNPDPRHVLRARERHAHRWALVFDHRVLEFDNNSGDLRMYSILRILRLLSWNITFYPANRACTEPYTTRMRQAGIEVVGNDVTLEDFLDKRGNLYDLVLLSRYTVAAGYIDRICTLCPRSLILVDFPDLESVRLIREAELAGDQHGISEGKRISLIERELARKADLVTTITETERNVLLNNNTRLEVEVVPNVHEPKRKGLPFGKREGLLFVAGFEHSPNTDAVLFMVNQIYPLIRRHLRSVELLIVGSEMPEAVRNIRAEGVRVLGFVENLDYTLASCRVFVAPLRYGAGLKGKVGMAMAAGLPVVTTSIGAEGIENRGEKRLLVADDPGEFADKVVRLYTDHTLWQGLSKNAKTYANANYSPATIRRRLHHILDKAYPVNFEERARLALKPPVGDLTFGQVLVRSLFPDRTKRGELRLIYSTSRRAISEHGFRTYLRMCVEKLSKREFRIVR
jgi:GT2 family glycosyltransferase